MDARHLTRRRFIAITAAAGVAVVTGPVAGAQRAEGQGGIGLSRAQFEASYGSGTPVGDLVSYPNPYLEGSRLSVAFQDDVAVFIQASVAADMGVMADQGWKLAADLMPQDATQSASWVIPAQQASELQFLFGTFQVPSLQTAGPGVQACVMTASGEDAVQGVTVPLAIPGGADQFAPADGSVGIGNSGQEWSAVHGEPLVSGAAAGTYFAQYDVPPWDSVKVRSHRAGDGQTVITLIDATSQDGVSVDAAMAFADSILPQGAQRQAAFEALPTEDGPQGWGTSVWLLPDGSLMMLFSLGAGDGSDTVTRVAASSAVSTG